MLSSVWWETTTLLRLCLSRVYSPASFPTLSPPPHLPWGHPLQHQSPHLHVSERRTQLGMILSNVSDTIKPITTMDTATITCFCLWTASTWSQLWICTRLFFFFFKLHFLGVHLQDKALWSRHLLTYRRVRKQAKGIAVCFYSSYFTYNSSHPLIPSLERV